MRIMNKYIVSLNLIKYYVMLCYVNGRSNFINYN